MGSNSKLSVDGVENVEMESGKRSVYDVLLRCVGLLLTLTATVMVGVGKQTKVISYADFQFKATAKWEYMSATV